MARLRAQIILEGPLKPGDWLAIAIFGLTIARWITLSETLGLGTVAIMGARLFLVAGLVRWEDINSGVNWGVVLLYAAAISLGVEMKSTGAAQWVAESFLSLLAPFGADHRRWAVAAAVAVLTTAVTNTITAGAAVAVLGPVVLNTAAVSGDDPIVVGFVTAVASAFAYLTAGGTPGLHHHLRVRLPQAFRVPQGRLAHDHRLDRAADGGGHPRSAVPRQMIRLCNWRPLLTLRFARVRHGQFA